MKYNLTTTLIIAVFVGAGAFYGGMQYQKSQRPAGMQFAGRFNGVRGEGGFARGGTAQGQGTRPVSGEIVSQDADSITVKLPDGSSTIVLLSEKTVINKTSEGSKTDLKEGETVFAFGTQNADGSLTAENVSIGGGMTRMRGPGTGGQSAQDK